jgi:hypothetical protein
MFMWVSICPKNLFDGQLEFFRGYNVLTLLCGNTQIYICTMDVSCFMYNFRWEKPSITQIHIYSTTKTYTLAFVNIASAVFVMLP